MEHEIDPVLEGLTEQQLKDSIVRNVKEINRLKQDGKIYAKGVRETIKALDERSVDALELLELRRVEPAG